MTYYVDQLVTIWMFSLIAKAILFVPVFFKDGRGANEDSFSPFKKYSFVGSLIFILLFLDAWIVVGIIYIVWQVLYFIFHKREPREREQENRYNNYRDY